MKKILLCQPHSDDILFSASHFLFDCKYDVTVLTIENNPVRIKEDEKLYEFLKKKYYHLKLEFNDQSFYGFYKKYDKVTVDYAKEWLTDFFGKDVLISIRLEIEKFIKKFFSENPNAEIAIPWGIGHPFHIFVRDTIENILSEKIHVMYYRDFPHSYKRRAKLQINEELVKYFLKESISTEKFEDVKWALAHKFYKSQSGLLWFEQNYIKKHLSEEIYEKDKMSF